MSQHTPGPWTIELPDMDPPDLDDEEEGDELVLLHRDSATISAKNWSCLGRVYVRCADDTDEAGLANARLIAASPELLAVLNKICDEVTVTGGLLMATVQEALAVVAKAEGI